MLAPMPAISEAASAHRSVSTADRRPLVAAQLAPVEAAGMFHGRVECLKSGDMRRAWVDDALPRAIE